MGDMGPVSLTPGVVVGSLISIVSEEKRWPDKVEEVPLPVWDTGVFNTELLNLGLTPQRFTDFTAEDRAQLGTNPEALLSKAEAEAPPAIVEGTYRGTQLALTKIYQTIESR